MAVVVLWPSYSRASDVSIHGFLQGNYSLNTETENPDSEDYKWAEERVQLKLDADKGPFSLFLKMDAFYDHVDDEEADVELREGYIDLISESWDIRLGRQVITWGVGDLIFINDVFPKDHEAFFSGRPMEYLKKGVDGVKVGLYPSVANLELVAVPFFRPDTFPSKERFHDSPDMSAEEPSTTLENTELALRAYRGIGAADASIYFYKGFYRMPAMAFDGEFFYPERSVYGASIEGRALDGIFGLEAGYYDSREDRGGDDPAVPNSSTRFLASYNKQLVEDFTAGLQYYGEYMHGYSEYEENLPPGFTREDALYHLATLRLTRFLMHQNLRLSLFAFYSPSDEDYMINPEVKYNFTDNVWASVGGNVFGGEDEQGRFGHMEKNDNAYVQVRYEF